MSDILRDLRRILAETLLGWAVDVAPEPESTQIAQALLPYVTKKAAAVYRRRSPKDAP